MLYPPVRRGNKSGVQELESSWFVLLDSSWLTITLSRTRYIYHYCWRRVEVCWYFFHLKSWKLGRFLIENCIHSWPVHSLFLDPWSSILVFTSYSVTCKTKYVIFALKKFKWIIWLECVMLGVFICVMAVQREMW